MNVEQLLKRARSVKAQGVRYKLGAGGMRPLEASPSNVNRECDCSGYVCWAFGISRFTDHPLYRAFNGGWINTDAMVRDAMSQTGFFETLTAPRVGCIVVYPSARPRIKVGHVGIVSALGSRGEVRRVIHCSNGNFRNFGDAIRETPPTVFMRPETIIAWYAGIEE